MRLLALVTEAFGGHGGIARYNRDLLTALSRSSPVEAVIVVPRFGDVEADLPPRVAQRAARPGRLGWSAAATEAALRMRPDAIFCGHLNAAPLAAALSRVLRRPLWLQLHGIEAWPDRGRTMRRAARAASLVTAVSRHTRRRFLGWSDLPPERVRVLPNTLDAVYRPRPRRADLVGRYGLEGRRVVLTVGRLAPSERYKGHDRVIAALPRILARVPDMVYLIVGGGEDRARLEALARTGGVASHVVFAGRVADGDLPDHYALADVFAMPSTGEGFGIVFLEAAASGLAVIGGDRDGSLDALADGAIGRAIDPDDPIALGDALVTALKTGEAADPAALRRFAFDHFARHVDALVRSLGR